MCQIDRDDCNTMRVPKRKDVILWLKKIWEEFPVEMMKNSFTGSEYCFEDGIDYSGETESESNNDD